MLLSEELMKSLICPRTGLSLFYDAPRNMLVNQDESYGYHIRDGIPILVAEMAVELAR